MGFALTSRSLEGFAQRRGYPLLRRPHRAGDARVGPGLGAARGAGREPDGVWLEADLRFDLRCLRHRRMLAAELERFQPDVSDDSPGPSHHGILGVWAWLRATSATPRAGWLSWHTNIHEYAGRPAAAERWLAGAVRSSKPPAVPPKACPCGRPRCSTAFAQRTLAPNPS